MMLAYFFFALGIFFIVFGNIGLVRFPDLYTRLHAATKSGVAGLLSIFLGLIIYCGWSGFSSRLILLALFVLITNPVAAHAIARAAYEALLPPWKKC